MSFDCIVQRVQYKYFDCHHQVLLLSLDCRILVQGTQKHNLSNLFVIQLHFLHTPIHGILSYHSCQLCVIFGVFSFQPCSQTSVFKALSKFSWQVMNHVWFMFKMMNKWMWEYILASKYSGWIINSLFCLYYQQNLACCLYLKKHAIFEV